MPPRKKDPAGPVPVEAFKHDDKRVNNPTADSGELMSPDVAQSKQLRYPRNPDLDPQLVWAGKDEQDGEDLVVDAPPIYIQEKIAPQVIIENLRKVVEKPELTLFDDFDGLEGYEAVEYYKHEANWSNRMILGDSLQVMASLAEKENLRGKVQMVYLDPPYGIKFGSNWQTRTDKRDVRDSKVEDFTREVEQIKAFRDTWIDGINTYLAYLRDRLTVTRDLLADSGSVFVQIGEDNVHFVRSLLDEVFGAENAVVTIIFRTTGSLATSYLGRNSDYILWYAKSLDNLKARKLYRPTTILDDIGGRYVRVELPNGTRRSMSPDERLDPRKLPAGSRIYRHDNLVSQGATPSGTVGFEFDGITFHPGRNSHWKTTVDGLNRLRDAGRLAAPTKNSLAYVRFLDDFPVAEHTNVWSDTQTGAFTDDKVYVVQTNAKVIERCLVMATDPSDLVIDPTCGSGTTAFVAEKWGRRWITVDTSRVALALARQRIMGSRFPYYALVDSNEIRKGFIYESVPHITLKSIATNPDIKLGMNHTEINAAIRLHAETEKLYDRAEEDTRKIRVSGPFTVESLSPHSTVAPVHASSEETGAIDDGSAFEKSIVDNLLKAGVQNGRKAERLLFESLAPTPVSTSRRRASSGRRSSGSRSQSGRGTGRWTRSSSGSPRGRRPEGWALTCCWYARSRSTPKRGTRWRSSRLVEYGCSW